MRSSSSGNTIGFVKDENRLNVALTRAKFALYVVGNFQVLKVSPLKLCSVFDALLSYSSPFHAGYLNPPSANYPPAYY